MSSNDNSAATTPPNNRLDFFKAFNDPPEPSPPVPSSSEREEERQRRQGSADTNQDDAAFLGHHDSELFAQESLTEQIQRMRQHLAHAGRRYERLHTINQATLLLPPEQQMRNLRGPAMNSLFGSSPLRDHVFTSERRATYDFWLQEELEFTELCFHKLEDVCRVRIVQEHRVVFDRFLQETFEIKAYELELEETEVRQQQVKDACWREWLEIFAMFELEFVVLERNDWLLRLLGAKCFVLLWSPCSAIAQRIVDEEEAERAPIELLHRGELIRLKRSPLLRFWIAKDDDDEVPDVVAADDVVHDKKAATTATKSRSLPAAHQKQRQHHPAAIAAQQQHELRILRQRNEQRSLFSQEHRARLDLLDEHRDSAAANLWTKIVPESERIVRFVTADKMLRVLIKMRQQCWAEFPFAEILDQEFKMRNKWIAVETWEWTNDIAQREEAEWARLLNDASLVHHLDAFIAARNSRRLMLQRSLAVIARFVRQRRAVQRVINMRRNVARFLQRCARGFLVRRKACSDRLFMLKCRADAQFRQRCALAALMTRFVRARLSRGAVVARLRAVLLQRWIMWRRSCVSVRCTYNARLAPHAAVILAHVAARFSALRTSHKDRHRAARILQRNIAAHRMRQNTKLAVIAMRLLLARKSAVLARARRIRHSLAILQLFAASAIDSHHQARCIFTRRVQATLMLQRIGRAAICRNDELKPAHLFTVQEQRYAYARILRWWRRLRARFVAKTFVAVSRYALLTLQRKHLREQSEVFLNGEVSRIAATKLSSWWRMVAQRRRYCAGRIAEFYVRHRSQCQFNFLRRIYGSNSNRNAARPKVKTISASSSSPSAAQRSSVLVVGDGAAATTTMMLPRCVSPHNSKNTYIVDAEDDDYEQLQQQSLSNEVAELLEAQAIDGAATIVEAFAASRHKIRLQFTFESLTVFDNVNARQLTAFFGSESALRSRIETQHRTWLVSLRRLKRFVDIGVRYFFIPFEYDSAEDGEDEAGYPGIAEKQATVSTSSLAVPSLRLLPSEQTRRVKRRRRYTDAADFEAELEKRRDERRKRRRMQKMLQNNNGKKNSKSNKLLSDDDEESSGVDAATNDSNLLHRRITAGEQWHRENRELEDWKQEQQVKRLRDEICAELERSKAETGCGLPRELMEYFGIPAPDSAEASAAATTAVEEDATVLNEGDDVDFSDFAKSGDIRKLREATATTVTASISDRLRDRRRSSGIMVGIDDNNGGAVISTRTVLLPSDLDFHVREKLEELQELKLMQEERRRQEREAAATTALSAARSSNSFTVIASSASFHAARALRRQQSAGSSRAAASSHQEESQRRPLSAITLSRTAPGDSLLAPKDWLKLRRREQQQQMHQIQQQQQPEKRGAVGNDKDDDALIDAAICSDLEKQQPFDNDIAARAPQPEFKRVTSLDYISPERYRTHFAASSAASQAGRRRQLAEHGVDNHMLEQMRPELLKPPSGTFFDAFDGRFDVCRWWGSRIGPSTAAAPRVSQFGSASLSELSEELRRSKPIETLAMASPWFPLNGGAIALIVDAALELNRKNLLRVEVSSEDDKGFVERLLRREGMSHVKVLVE